MKKMFKTIPIILAVSMLFLYSCDKDEDPMSDGSYTDIMASKLKMDLVDDASISPYDAIFDVSPYYNNGHVPFATNTGGNSGLENMLGGLDTSKTYLVYCHSDGPSIEGAKLLTSNGFMHVYRLQGNYGAWDAVSFLDIAAMEAKSKIDAGSFEAIFDVSPHYSSGHLPGATNANAGAGGTDLSVLIADMDKTKAYLVYCHANGPAMAGAQLMEDAGFSNVYRLEGNYGAWVDAGYTTEK